MRNDTVTTLKTAYLDDTGKYENWARMVKVLPPREPGGAARTFDPLVLLGIGGATATVEAWERVGAGWSEALQYFSLPMFHAADFDRGAKPFDVLSKTDKEGLVSRLVACLSGMVQSFVAVVRPEAYAYSHSGPVKTGQPGEPREHDPCFWFCLRKAAEHGADAATRVVFADTPKYAGRPAHLLRCFTERHPLGTRLDPAYTNGATPKSVVQLQAADLITWGFARICSSNPEPDDAAKLESLAWWAEQLDGLFNRDFTLLSRDEALSVYAEIECLCY